MNVIPTNILWPTDFSDLSTAAVPYVRQYREIFQAKVHVIHVCVPVPDPDFLPDSVALSDADIQLTRTWFEASKDQVQRMVDEHLVGIPDVVTKVIRGHPWHEICGYAKESGIDLIILGTHGRTGLRHALMGSVAERVVQHAHCPVLTFKSPV